MADEKKLTEAERIAQLEAENKRLREAAAVTEQRNAAIEQRMATGQLTREQAEAAVLNQEKMNAAEEERAAEAAKAAKGGKR
jgi:hypothetical protein